MLKQENLAANFCGILATNGHKDLAIEWRILGQEQDGSLLASWISISPTKKIDDKCDRSHVGIYNPAKKTFDVLYSFRQRENVIQASVNASRTLLSYVIKTTPAIDEHGQQNCVYIPYIVEIRGAQGNQSDAHRLLTNDKTKQVMTQFLWRKKLAFEKNYQDKLLVFVHEECINMFKATIIKQENTYSQCSDDLNCTKIDFDICSSWHLDRNNIASETIVKHFIWAQWDPVVQALYYIHLKPTMRSSLEKQESDNDFTTTLSAHQFHENLPRETVVSAMLFGKSHHFAFDCFSLNQLLSFLAKHSIKSTKTSIDKFIANIR